MKKHIFNVASFGVATLAFGLCTTPGLTFARASTSQQEPDNTGANKSSNNPDGTTADQQKETPADRALAQKIRKSIMNDKSLSSYGHNVKVIVRDSKVTLKGPVQSEEEKKIIGDKAAEIAGAQNVQNDLTIAS